MGAHEWLEGKIAGIASGVRDFAENAKVALDIDPAQVIKLKDGDVYKNYRWSVNEPNQKFITDVPVIQLIEYQSSTGPILEGLEYNFVTLTTAAGQSAASAATALPDGERNIPSPEPYLDIYSGVFTENVYRLPFFSPYHHTLNNTWGEANQDHSVGTLKKYVEKAADFAQYGNIEKRRIWKASQPAGYQFTFYLYNTFDVSDIPKNFEFIRTLTHNNLPTRTSFATLLPPCFYKVEIPGVRYAPIAVMSSVDVQNIGQVNRRKMMVDNGVNAVEEIWMNIPDAWEVTVNMNELHNESRDIFNSTFTNDMGSKVSVIDDQEANDSNLNIRTDTGAFLP